MDDEILIENVRQYDELYNMSHRKYNNNHHKGKIWAKIGKELNTTGKLCKSRWISLRDQLRKVLKKKKRKIGRADVIQKKWKYEDCMSFVIPFFKERDTHFNIESPESANEETNDEDISHQNKKMTDPNVLNEDEENKQEVSPKRSKIIGSQKTNSPKKMPASYYSKAKQMNEPSVLIKYILDSENNEQKVKSNAHPIDIFFNGLAATVKTFSPEYQHMAKNKLFTIVSDLEWAQLQNKTINNLIPVSVDSLTPYIPSSSTMTVPAGIQNSLLYDNQQLIRQGSPSQNNNQYVQTDVVTL